MDRSHLSPQAHQRLVDELTYRSGPGRRELSRRLEHAREHGDIRENADFDAAKNEQGLNEARIRQLDAMLRTAVVVEGTESDVVQAGVVVELRMGDNGETTTYLVGSIEERHDTYDVLSLSSPLGKLIVGKTPGEQVDFKGPKRSFQVEIVSVSLRVD